MKGERGRKRKSEMDEIRKRRSFRFFVQLQQNIINNRDDFAFFNSDGFPNGPLISAYHGFADFLLMDTRITAPIYWRISLTHLIILLLQSQDYNPLFNDRPGKNCILQVSMALY